MLDGVSITRSEKVKDEIVLDGNDIELVSRSAALINQVAAYFTICILTQRYWHISCCEHSDLLASELHLLVALADTAAIYFVCAEMSCQEQRYQEVP